MEYDEEEQRYQTSAAILMCTFCGCRLCSLFNTRVKVNNFTDDGPSETCGGATTNSQDDGKSNPGDYNVKNGPVSDDVMDVDSNSDTLCDYNGDNDSDSTTVYDSDGDSDSNSRSSSLDDCGSGYDTDDDCLAGSEETKACELIWDRQQRVVSYVEVSLLQVREESFVAGLSPLRRNDKPGFPCRFSNQG